ncbi:MAG: hypothetical protein ABIJ03_03810 [Patescibacteria group bacterium]
MGSKRNVNMSDNTDKIKVLSTSKSLSEEVTTSQAVDPATTAQDNQSSLETPADKIELVQEVIVKKKPSRQRSKRYLAGRSIVDRTKEYDSFAAVELVKKLSHVKFDATITADINCLSVGDQTNVTLPHSTGSSVKIAIVDDDLLAKIAQGEMDFDVLLSAPAFMPKLAKLARILGPKGLMPNPKNGTITDKPEIKKKELEQGGMTVRTERKTPVTHVIVGKISMDTKELVENINALINALSHKAIKLTLSATMSPGVKVKLG